MATIATHNGSKVCRDHNIRNPKVTQKENHIDPNGHYEIWHDEKIREAYKRIFGEALKEYNDRQTREERKISNYYNKVAKDSKKHVAYEMIYGVYGKDVSDEIKKEILQEFHRTWKERNPSLEIIGAYYHADEQGEQHVHVDYVPVGKGYSKGMAVQNGLNKALDEMGFRTITKAETAQIQWERRENKYLEQLCRQRGIDVERPKDGKREHEEKEEYQNRKDRERLQREVDQLENKKTAIQKDIQDLKEQKGPIGRIGPLKEEIRELRVESKNKDREIAGLKIEKANLKDENTVLKDRLERKKEQQPSIDAVIENEKYKARYTYLRKWADKVLDFIQKHAPNFYQAIVDRFGRGELDQDIKNERSEAPRSDFEAR